MISSDRDKKKGKAWAKKNKFPFPVVRFKDRKKLLVGKYAARGIPHFVLIDKTGKVLATGMQACKAKIKKL